MPALNARSSSQRRVFVRPFLSFLAAFRARNSAAPLAMNGRLLVTEPHDASRDELIAEVMVAFGSRGPL
jgi:hypothetical protein